MRCPYCGFEEDRVLDTRSAAAARAIRRRRECLKCGRRFTTYEQVEEMQVMVVKRDGRRETFERLKILNGLKAACQKRLITTSTLEAIVDDIERNLYNQTGREVASAAIGEMVMEQLRAIDSVAYVRFASVYRAFENPEQFRELVDVLAAHSVRREESAGEISSAAADADAEEKSRS